MPQYLSFTCSFKDLKEIKLAINVPKLTDIQTHTIL